MHYGHDHNDDGAHCTAAPGLGHNAPPVPRAAQWQTPHQPPGTGEAGDRVAAELDVDLVERAFVDGFLASADATSFLRLARVPLVALGPDGVRLVLLRVELEALTDVGSVTPQLGGEGFRYDPLPAKIVSQRRRLRFAYFDGTTVRPLLFHEVRRLTEAG
jgi:hypothetical protein